MSCLSDVLEAREKRRLDIVSLSESNNVVTIKANIPGKNKRIYSAYALTGHFARLCHREGDGDCQLWDGADGPTVVFTTTADPETVKQRCVNLEETHPLGRFVDLDVWKKGEQKSLSRGYMRRCYICDKPAFVCGRMGGHPIEQLIGVMEEAVDGYFRQIVEDACADALQQELELHPKFGLVTPFTNGSHPDMSYDLMKKAHRCVAQGIADMFIVGLRGEDVYRRCVEIGIETENKMLVETQGRNAYKGFIFVAGLLSAAMGQAVASGGGDIYETVSRLVKDIEMGRTETFGDRAYRQYGFGGVRQHARQGFPFVRKVADNVQEDSNSKLEQLVCCAAHMEDSVMLKRAGSMEKFKNLQHRFKQLDLSDCRQVDELDGYCIENNISLGGCADVLASGIFVKNVSSKFVLKFDAKQINKEEKK